MKLILLLILSTLQPSTFQLLQEGHEQYAAGNYAEAAVSYQQAIEDMPTAEGYYNLGNACFKQGELAQAILSYERALRIRPLYSDARHNLAFAQSRIVDNIEDNGGFFVASWFTSLRNLLSTMTWLGLSIGAFWLLLIGVLCFLLSRNMAIRKAGFFVALLMLVMTIWTGANAASLHHRNSARAEAIVTQGIVNAKSSPDRSGTDLFTLHEGTKVTIRETIGTWANIHVGNNIGWIPLRDLERI